MAVEVVSGGGDGSVAAACPVPDVGLALGDRDCGMVGMVDDEVGDDNGVAAGDRRCQGIGKGGV